MTLTLREVAHSGNGLDMRKWSHVYKYEVQGLPATEEVWIAEMHHRWQILRRTSSVQGDWTGEYASPEEALRALQQSLAI